MEESVYNALLTENEKRKIRRQAKQFVAKDNLLYFLPIRMEKQDGLYGKQKSTGFFELAKYLFICLILEYC